MTKLFRTIALVGAIAIGSFAFGPVMKAQTAPANPTVPTNFSATVGSDSSSVNLSWTGSTDTMYPSSGLTYEIFRDGTQVATTSPGSVSFADTGLTPSTSYSYAIAAMDSSGNNSGQSAALTVMTNAGSTTPTSTPSTATYGWLVIPQSLYNSISGSISGSASSSPFTYINGYPTLNGNYLDCYGNVDNDMAHHTTNANDTDPAHHSGMNCPNGGPTLSQTSGINLPAPSSGTGPLIAIPLNLENYQALMNYIK